ncbi:unnamed protein product [Linum trigynum]|uniref:Uncharacterized protein n=1 Tax=Linum trigynum TaxID=586398 RepID=A0AAV2D360_9ROSI
MGAGPIARSRFNSTLGTLLSFLRTTVERIIDTPQSSNDFESLCSVSGNKCVDFITSRGHHLPLRSYDFPMSDSTLVY